MSQGSGYQSREFKTCRNREFGFVWVDFYHKRLVSKYAYWG